MEYQGNDTWRLWLSTGKELILTEDELKELAQVPSDIAKEELLQDFETELEDLEYDLIDATKAIIRQEMESLKAKLKRDYYENIR